MKYLFYVLPALVNIITGVFFFITPKRLADSGANSFMVALTIAVWAAVYAVTAFSLGYIQNKRNATKLIFIGQGILLASMVGLLVFQAETMQYIWLLGTGLGTAMFFAPFQMVVKMFEKEDHSLNSVAKSTGIYTFSWSTGLASGPFIAALVWGMFSQEHGWKYCYGINILLILFVIACVIFMRKFVNEKLRLEETPVQDGKETEIPAVKEAEFTRTLPDLMVAAWVLTILGYIGIMMMRTHLPDYCTKTLRMTTVEQGIVIAVISYTQGLVGLGFWKLGRRLYHPGPAVITSIGGVAALLIFALNSGWIPYLLGAVLLGCFSGMFCFLCTFHALVHPEKTPRYVSVNETIVGVTSTFAPLLGGYLSMLINPVFPFYLCAGLTFLAMLSYLVLTWKYRRF